MDIRMAPKLAMHNKSVLANVTECACYHCRKVFVPGEIQEWTDKDDTAVCPYCFIDAVIPVYSAEEKDDEFLVKLNEYWF
jgi:hypothetical protein